MWSQNFKEFMRFLSKGLNSFIIQVRLKLEFILNFVTQNLESLEDGPKRKMVPYEFSYQLAKFRNF
jgi:hypothetical protein